MSEQFLESTATQLSYHGLCELNATASEGEISVFFRNNHFSTMIKHKVRACVYPCMFPAGAFVRQPP